MTEQTPPRRLFISFSGGETSALMMLWILLNWRDRYDDIRVVFANTGQENEKTLVFVDRVSKHFGVDIVWVEAVVHQGERRATTHRVVTFETASRQGEPFEEVIRKYGITNKVYTHCTPELKRRPMESYLASIGWAKGTYDTAIGIRADEADRISSQSKKRRLVYPLLSAWPTTKPEVNAFWRAQPFRLGLKGYEGNCSWCWKKSLRKHLTIIGETPEVYDFPRRMEALYGDVGAEFVPKPGYKPLPEGYRRHFFRGGASTDDLFGAFRNRRGAFSPAPDDADVYPDFDPDLDTPGGGCVESCEVYGDDEQPSLFDLPEND